MTDRLGVSDTAPWLSDAQDRVAAAQQVLAEVDRGLHAAAKVEQAARRARPVLRAATVVLLAGVAVIGVAWLIRRRRSQLPTPADGIAVVEATDVPPARG
jgi:hypothetical protein